MNNYQPGNRNFSRKMKNCRYKRRSMKTRIKELVKKRRAKFNALQTKSINNSKFSFFSNIICCESFFKNFCNKFIFSADICQMHIPKPHCFHVEISSWYIEDLIKGRDVLSLIHRRYCNNKKFSNKISQTYSIEEKLFDLCYRYARKSKTLPFVLMCPSQEEVVENLIFDIEALQNNDSYPFERLEYFQNNVDFMLANPQNCKQNAFQYRSGLRTTYIEPSPDSKDGFKIFSEMYLEIDELFLLENVCLIIHKYLKSVLFTYFSAEFSMQFSKLQQEELEIWFKAKTEEYSLIHYNDACGNSFYLSEKVRYHGRCKLMRGFKNQPKKVH